jgi:hypothetical protein
MIRQPHPDGDAFHVHNAFRSPGRLFDGECGMGLCLQHEIGKKQFSATESPPRSREETCNWQPASGTAGMTFMDLAFEPAAESAHDRILGGPVERIAKGMGRIEG